jgi:glucoamylase
MSLCRSLLLTVILLPALALSASTGDSAPGAHGTTPTWTSAAKDAVGTSTSTESRVWFTLQGGILTEVYYPRLDNANVRTLEFAVSDRKTVWVESSDLRHSIERLSSDALLYKQTSRDANGSFELTKTYATDPHRDTLLIDVTFKGGPEYSLYLLYNPALENSGDGNTAQIENGTLIAKKSATATALLSSGKFSQASAGFAGVSDGYTDLRLHRDLQWKYIHAENGNVVLAAKVEGPHFTLSLGFGVSSAAAVANARASLQQGFPSVSREYAKGWLDYSATLHRVNPRYESEFELAAMVLKAHEDKTFRGAMIASMSIPWGFAVKSNAAAVGGYHLVWGRDLYEVATALLAAGDRDAAERALTYLFSVQQQNDGSFPQNSWLDGKPYWTHLQMDEVAYPIILASQLNRTDADTWKRHVKPAAEFIVTRGPVTEQERWEEVPGYSPSTMAAEIAGLVCAADIARKNSADEDAQRYLQIADSWSGNLENWLVTRTGHLDGSDSPGYYIRIDNNMNPNDGYALDVRNGGGTWDERDIVDAGFLELVRLGIRPPDDPVIANSVKVVDRTIRVETPNGPSFHRYNHDGYGETYFGGPWLGEGIGRIWPIFTGERGEYEVARNHDPSPYLESMMRFANDGGMIPEQIWDFADGTNSSFIFGRGTGSATPLAWSMAQFIRLALCAQEKRIVEQPRVVAEHFLKTTGPRAAE